MYVILTWLKTTNVVFIGHLHDGDILLLTTLLDFAHSIYINACVNYSQMSVWLLNFSRSRIAVSGARPSQRGRMPKPWSKRCLFIFFKLCSATYLFINLVDITSCFASLVAAEDDKLDRTTKISPCLINYTRQENSQVFSVFDVEFGLSSLWFDSVFAGWYNSNLVALDHC